MSVVWLIGVFLITLEADFAIGIIASTDCNATRKEYDSKDCSDLFSTCIHKLSGCHDTTRFCSNDCREIYHRMRNCDNSSFSQVGLDKLDLLCSPSSSEHNKTCADLVYSDSPYGYRVGCFSDLLSIQFGINTTLLIPCSMSCNETLASYKDECCAINAGLLDEASLTPDKESIHTDRIWTVCGISSPGKCPSPPPPSGPTVSPTLSPTVSSTPSPTVSSTPSPTVSSTPSVSDGMVKIEANCLLFFTIAALLCMYTLY